MRRFLALERTLHGKRGFEEFAEVIEEYFEKGHAELVPAECLGRACQEVFYLPMHAVVKESSTTT